MGKLAVIFAGQGSQYPNMGLDYLENQPQLKKKIDTASNILGFDVIEVLTSNDSRINETIYTQPLVFLVTMLAYEQFKNLNVSIDAVAGFSLGEYSALYASEIYTFEATLDMIKMRSLAMHQCSNKHPGKMAAILGLSSSVVDLICEEASSDGIVVSANYNSPVQVVISGEEHAVLKAIDLAKQKGAKRAIMLNVSGAFHSPLMREAGDDLALYIKDIAYKEPIFPIYMNTTAKPLIIDNLHQEMKKQIQSSVYFEQTIKQMIEDGFTHFIEIGPGNVISGLIKKIDLNSHVSHLDKLSDLDALKGWLENHGFNK
ncbi:MAG: ACP S-malonyltransferase [Acholeplasmataceae bacterium]|nr:ACP S-malonyltransferase [Acholeplasmataceae bacterium]